MKRTEMKKFRIYKQSLVTWAMICLAPAALLGQQEEVRVVKPYSPTLSGAHKIELLPSLNEEIEFEVPDIDYHLAPKRYDSQFRVQPIRAARMVKMPLERLYKSQLTLGMGNYLTPLAELSINQLRSRNGTFGLNVKHHSMHGNVELDNGLKAPAGFNENQAEIYGSRFLKESVFEYSVGASYNSYVHYGIDPGLDSVLNKGDEVHPYFTAETGIGLHSMHADSFHFNYDGELEYYYFTHQFEQAEHGARAAFEFNKALRVVDLEGEVGGQFYGRSPDWDTAIGNQTHLWINPAISKGSSQWRFTAGVNTHYVFTDGGLTFRFYPRGSFQFNMVKQVIVPYFGVDGYLESYGSRHIVEDNPYVVPGLTVKPTDHKLIGYFGLKGRFSDAIAYNLKASYSIIDDAYFYVNDNSNPLMNQFRVVYDDITLARLHGELTIRPDEDWKFFLQGNYYNYLSLVSLERPWNKPGFDIRFQARYNMGDKILIDAGVFAIGSRYYENYDPGTEATLPLTIDANLGLEYRYSKLLSFWLRLNNLAAQKYYLYPQYPSYRFRVMLGFTYAL
jgi:hypothetical protein